MVLVLAVGLAFNPNTRRLAAYISVCSTSGLIVSIAVSTLALILSAKIPWPAGGSVVGGVVLIGTYIGGMVLGGLAGIALSFWGLRRFMSRRERTCVR